jgi:hypothetical protein
VLHLSVICCISTLRQVQLAEACSILSSSDSTVAGDNLLLRALVIAPVWTAQSFDSMG